MKTNLLRNMLAKIVALFIAIIALPTTAQAQDYVDLGLPSGTKWATCNLGASKPSDYGSRQPRMQQGVNIVKMSDGTTRKVIRK